MHTYIHTYIYIYIYDVSYKLFIQRSYYMPMPDGSGKILHADANLAPV